MKLMQMNKSSSTGCESIFLYVKKTAPIRLKFILINRIGKYFITYYKTSDVYGVFKISMRGKKNLWNNF